MQRVAVVTGGSGGIGRAIVRALLSDGFKVMFTFHNHQDEAENMVSQFAGIGEAVAWPADVRSTTDVEQLHHAVEDRLGPVDVLVNNAGAIARGYQWPVLPDNIWNDTIDVNLTGAFRCIRAFAPAMKRRGDCSIINISSTYGYLGSAHVPAYTAAKAGLVNLTLAFAKELAPHVRVNSIAPGNIETEMTTAAGPQFLERVVKQTPLQRLGTPDDVAYATSFLASNRSSFITGHVLVVDGGHMLR